MIYYLKEIFLRLEPEFSKIFQRADPQHIEDFIQYGVDKAKKYDITSKGDVYQFLRLMFAYGRDFDKDEDLPWAAVILQEREACQREPTIQTLLEVCDYMIVPKEIDIEEAKQRDF